MNKLILLTITFLCCAALSAAPAKGKAAAKPKTKAPVVSTVSFSLPTARNDQTWSTQEYTGTPLLVAVLSSSCAYCQQTLPQLEEARRALRDVHFVAVFVDETPAAPLKLLKSLNARLDSVYGGASVAKQLGTDGYPALFLYDAQHKLLKKWSGYSETRVKELKDEAGSLEKETNMVSVEGFNE